MWGGWGRKGGGKEMAGYDSEDYVDDGGGGSALVSLELLQQVATTRAEQVDVEHAEFGLI